MVELAFGNSVDPNRVATVQSPGGTGALRIGAETVAKFFPGFAHLGKQSDLGQSQLDLRGPRFAVETYPYLGNDKTSLDLEAMLQHLETHGRANDLICLHACCHNPTGSILPKLTGGVIASLLQRKHMLPFIDYAYQGFGEGLV